MPNSTHRPLTRAVGAALLCLLGVLSGALLFNRTAHLTIDTDPPGGTIVVDAHAGATAPVEYDLRSGNHKVMAGLASAALPPPRSPHATLKTLRTAYIPITGNLPLYVALERGYFERYGLRVEATEANSPNDILTGLASGKLDFAASLAYTILFPAAVRYPDSFRLFSSLEETRDKYTSGIIVLKGSAIRSYEQLRGKRIGVYQGIVQVVLLKLILERMGIAPSEVKIVEISPRLQIQGLVGGQYDALSTNEPTVNVAVIEGLAEILVANPRTRFVLSPFPSAATAVSTRLLKEDPAAANNLAHAFDLAVELIQRDPEVAKQYLPKYTPVPRDITSKVLASLRLFKFNKLGEENRLNVQRLADYLYKAKLESQSIPDVNVLFGDYEPTTGSMGAKQ